MKHDPRAFGRKPAPRRTLSQRQAFCVALMLMGFGNVALALILTFFDVKPAAPFFVMLAGFVLLMTAILGWRED